MVSVLGAICYSAANKINGGIAMSEVELKRHKDRMLLKRTETELNAIRASLDESEELNTMIKKLRTLQESISDKLDGMEPNDDLTIWLCDISNDVGEVAGRLSFYRYIIGNFKQNIEVLERRIAQNKKV